MQRNTPSDRALMREFPKTPRAPKTAVAELPDPAPCDDARCRHNCPWTGWSIWMECLPCGHTSHAAAAAESPDVGDSNIGARAHAASVDDE